MKKQYWLGNYKNVNKYGWSMDLELLDGPHSEPKGVREAKHIIQGIVLDKGKERNYVMVTIEDIPQGQIDVNEEAIEQNRQVVERYSNGGTAGLCDNCKVPKMINTGGDGIHEPANKELYCKKKEMFIEQKPPEDQVKECDGFEPCR